MIKYSLSWEVFNNWGPHYWNKDETETYLIVTDGFANNTFMRLFSISELRNGCATNQPAPIIMGTADGTEAGASTVGTASISWKSAAISSKLGRILTVSPEDNRHGSLPIDEPWEKDETVFEVTKSDNIPFDSADFSMDGVYLYSNGYNSPRNRLYRWDVGNLLSNNVALTLGNYFDSSITRVRSINLYQIDGRELIYYGEGAASGDTKVCVWDTSKGFSVGAESVLVPSTGVNIDIMNVKVAGITNGTPHLYVQFDNHFIQIYALSADGLSLAEETPVKIFTDVEMKALLGWGGGSMYMRAFEVTEDEKFAFAGHHYVGAEYKRLHVLTCKRVICPATIFMIN